MLAVAGVLLTKCLEGQCGEEDEQNRNQILESNYSQVAKHTCDLKNNTLHELYSRPAAG